MTKEIFLSKKISLVHDAIRGYGRCDRIYMHIGKNKYDGHDIYKAVDIGEGGEYQRSVSSVNGEFEKIAEYLKTVPVSIIEKFMDKYANESCCGIYDGLWSFEGIKRAVEKIEADYYHQEEQKGIDENE